MSSVNIRGVVNNMTKNTSIYSPIVEAVVNSIQSIEKNKTTNGQIRILLIRDSQSALKFNADALDDITSVIVEDNGEGFTDENISSFDMLYSAQKKQIGGKGFGRFTFLRYFESVEVESMFREDGKTFNRRFDFILNDKQKIVSNEKTTASSKTDQLRTNVFLNKITRGQLDKKLTTIARKLLEKLLIYFISDTYHCPKISVECDGDSVVLNDLLGADYPEIQQIDNNSFELQSEDKSEIFRIKIFKIFFPEGQKSKICLTAHNREVIETPIHAYIPEFSENFVDKFDDGTTKDYLIKTYVIGDYLDKKVSLERNGFSIPKSVPDLYSAFTQKEIEKNAAVLTQNSEAIKDVVSSRQEKKIDKVRMYVDSKAPWYKEFVSDLKIDSIPFQLDDQIIDAVLNKEKFEQEVKVRQKVKSILESDNHDELEQDVEEIVKEISKVKLTDLARYVAFRKSIIKLLQKSLQVKPDGKYHTENTVHSIIFPTKKNSENISYDDHNLWIIDEKLNFSEYISSDLAHVDDSKDRSDILIYNKKIAFRADNTSSNPITIFEFKKPQRDDFANKGSKEDPVLQIQRYVDEIMNGKHLTPSGRNIEVNTNTPFYGYVICDLTQKVKNWLRIEKDFKVMPDGKGWYRWYDNTNLYVEVLSWDKVWQDAEMRNKVFFHKLGIDD